MRLTPSIQKAIIVASLLHNDKQRKADGFPYIVHPFSVAFILAHYTDDEDTIVAGLLHDVLEDVPAHLYSAEKMKHDFGENVYRLVKEVSEDKYHDQGDTSIRLTWKERKERFLANLKHASSASLMICCADKIHNLRSLIDAYAQQGNAVWEKFHAPKQQTIWFFKEVLDIVKKNLHHEIVEEMEEAYREAKALFGN